MALNNMFDPQRNTPLAVFKEWKLAGIMGSPPEANHGTSYNAEWITNECVKNVYPLIDGQSVNYWKEYVSGDCNSFLFWVVIEVDIQSETCYVVEADGTGTKYVSNQRTNMERLAIDAEKAREAMPEGKEKPSLQAMMDKMKYVRHVPRVVPRFSNTKSLSLEDRMYTITGEDGKPLRKLGYVYRFGRCKKNDIFEARSAQGEKPLVHNLACNMMKTTQLARIDVQVDVQEFMAN
jgi:hypothetical protein